MTYEEYQQQLAQQKEGYGSDSGRDPQGFFGNVLDVLSRGQYFSAKFFDVLAKDGLGAFGDALTQGMAEAVSPVQRLGFEDVLNNAYPDMNPVAKSLLGTAGNLVIDPLNALSFGSFGAEKVFGRALSKLGMKTRSAIEMADAARAIAGDTEKLRKLAEMKAAVTSPEAKGLLHGMFVEKADQMGAETLGNVLHKDFSDDYLKKLAESPNPIETVRADFGNEAVNKLLQEPPVQEGHTRLYRGEQRGGTPTKKPTEATDAYFTPNRKYAEDFAKMRAYQSETSGGQLRYIDVPNDQVSKYLNTEGLNTDHYIIPRSHQDFFNGGVLSEAQPNKDLFPKLVDETGKPRFATGQQPITGDTLIPHLDERAKDLSWLAERIRSGEASLREHEFAWEFTKHASDSPEEALTLLKKAFPNAEEKVFKMDELKQAARRAAEDSADKKIAEMLGMEVTVDPKTGRMRLPKGSKPTKNLELLDKGGVKVFGQTVIPGEVFHALGNVSGLNKVLDKAKEVKWISSVVGAFNRNFKLPQEFLRLRQDYEASQLAVSGKLMNHLQDIFGGLSKQQRELIGKTSADIHFASIAAGNELNNSAILSEAEKLGRTLTEDEAKRIKIKLSPEQAGAIRNDILEKSGLMKDKEAYAAYVKLRHAYNEMGMAQMQGGLMEDMATNYNPFVYDMIKDPEKFRDFANNGPSAFLPAGIERTSSYNSLEEMKADGLEPQMDALTLYATRFIESKKALAAENFKHAVKHTFGVTDLKKLPKNIVKDMQFIGDGSYGGLGDAVRGAVQLYDRGLGMFKTMATVAKPSFGVRQAVSNALQSYLVSGTKAFRLFDPRSAMDALAVIMNKHGLVSPELLNGLKIETPFEKVFSGPELASLFEEFGVLRGTNISGGIYSKNSAKELAKHFPGNDPAASGLRKIAQGVMHYTNWPSHVEDYARASNFINGLRMGYSPRKAAEMVNVALFDYQNGLSRFGKVLGTRMVPFFSYTNFVLPLIGKIMMTHPNRIANVNKVAKGFLSVMNKLSGGETLSPSERQVLPGYLLEQPHYLEGFDEKTKAVFHTFNNFSPLDIMGTGQLDETGKIDIKSTIQKVALSQLTPFIKYPLEILAGKNYFTGLPINSMTAGKIGKVNPNEFISNLAGLVIGANQGNLVAGAIGKAVSDVALSPEFVQEGIKKLIGWEAVRDPRSGNETVYINPYMFHAMSTVIPALGSVVRMQRQDLKPQEKMADFLLGVGTLKQDLRRNLFYKNLDYKNALRDQKILIHKALQAGRYDRADIERENLQKLIMDIIAWRSKINSNDIRR